MLICFNVLLRLLVGFIVDFCCSCARSGLVLVMIFMVVVLVRCVCCLFILFVTFAGFVWLIYV